MDSSNNLIFANIDPDRISIYNDVDLNALFNFTYNFDLLKGIIGSLLKNQQNLQKQIEIANYINNEQDKTILSLKSEIIEIKEKYTLRQDFVALQDQVKKMLDTYQAYDDELAKSKLTFYFKFLLEMDYSDFEEKALEAKKNEENIKEFIDKNDFGFTKIKTFDQLRTKVLEIKRAYEKTKIDVGDNTQNINIISNKMQEIFGGEGTEGEGEEGGAEGVRDGEKKVKIGGGKNNQATSEGSKNNNLKNQISEMNKKIKFLLGDISLDDIENQNQNEVDQNKKKLMNFEEINRRLTKLQFTKVDNVELDSKNEKIISKIDDVDRRMNELIYGLYGDYHSHLKNDENHTKITFVTQADFDEYKANTENEFGKIWEEIQKLKRTIELIFDHLKEKASLKDLDDMKNYLLQKVEEIIMGLNKKFVERNENATAFKNLEDQFKKIIVLLATKAEHENDNWLIAKKPINGYSCAACESFIGELKEEQSNKYIPWNKMPIREREKEIEKEKEKIYRLGNGYSKVLKMVGVDNNGNVTLNPSSSIDVNNLFAGNNENIKTKEGFDLQINRVGLERVQSAHSKESKEKEKTIEVVRPKNYYDRKLLPKIKGSMSSDNFDKIIENPNPNLNIINANANNNTFINPKITKVLKKTQSKPNI